MASPIILLAGVPASTEVKLRAALPGCEVQTLSGRRMTPDAVRGTGAAAAVVSLEEDVELGFRLARELGSGGVRVVVVGPRKEADLILRAMRDGAKEFVLAGDDEALAKAVREQVRPATAEKSGMICAVFPAKGGVGSTTVATNLAGALQARGERTCVIDLNLNMGDVLAFLDLPGGYALSDVIHNVRRLDRDLLDASLLRHGSGVRVLAQSHRVDEADQVDAASLAAVLDFLRQHYSAIVLDGLRSFDDLSVTAVDASDHVLLLMNQEVPAVRAGRRCADLFRRLGCDGKLKLVVNRFQKGLEIDEDVVADTVGLPVRATVANDYPAVIRAVNRGVLLRDDAPRAQVTKDIEKLVALVSREEKAGAPAREKPSFLKRFLPLRPSHATE